MPTGNAIAALTFANYVLQPIYGTCTPPANAVRLIAASVVCKYTQHVHIHVHVYALVAFVAPLRTDVVSCCNPHSRDSTGLLTFINCYNVKWATTLQNTLTSAKVIALLIIIGAGAVHFLMGA